MKYEKIVARLGLVTLSTLIASNLFGQNANNSEEEVYELSPFLIESEEDDGYLAGATLAGTRIRTDLKDVGSSLSVVTEGFLEDTAATDAETLLVYTTNTEVAGQGGNFVGEGDGEFLTATNRTSPIANTRVRGLAAADNTRNFFLTNIPWDSYNVGRIDLQRGANSILFGIGSPAGIINSTIDSAIFANQGKIENKIDNWGTVRTSINFNKVLLEDELAIRVALLNNETKYRQKPAFKDDKRVYVALNFEPKALNTDTITTKFRANIEVGEIESNKPRATPPLDAITPWFTEMDKLTFAQADGESLVSSNPWLGAPGERVWDGIVTTFNGSVQGMSYPAKVQGWPDTSTPIPASIVGGNNLKGISTYNKYAGRAGLPYASINAYKARSLVDKSIFNFYDKLLEGPNKKEWNDFKAANFAIEQTFLNGKLGYELTFDKQKTEWGYDNFLSGDAAVITVDLIETLTDGTANPNVGRPFTIAGGGSAGGYYAKSNSETIRLTTFGEIDFKAITGEESFLGKVFGRNIFTGLYSRYKLNIQNRTYNRYYLSSEFAPNASQGAVGQASRDNIMYHYLGGDLRGASSASGAKLSNISEKITLRDANMTTYNNQTGEWQSIKVKNHNNDNYGYGDKTYRTARKYDDETESTALIWQGYWFNGTIIPMVGLRRDVNKSSDAGNPPSIGDGLVDPLSSDWKIPSEGIEGNGNPKTYSVVTHLPSAWRDRLPGYADVSFFYNSSENFQPDSSRRDIFGQSVGYPEGKTEEYGVTLTLLDNKLHLKWAHYDTEAINVKITNGIGGQYLIGAVEAWGQRAAYKFANEPGVWPASTIYGYSSTGEAVTWRPDGELIQDETGNYAYTQDVLDTTYASMQASVDAWFATQVPESFQNAWALTNYGDASYAGDTNYGASGLVVTGNTVSKGDEFEIFATPVQGLDISFNMSKTSAKRMGLAQPYVDWIEKRWEEFQGPAGDMRLWGGDGDWNEVSGGHSGESARGKFARETMAGYNLFKALEGADVPELRPWRFNLVTNYTFQDGIFKGGNVGASYRWQDKTVTGFPVITNESGNLTFDVKNPHHGPTEDAVDLWAGFEKEITEDITWRIQLNIRNAFSKDELIPVTVQPDGSYGAMRIREPRTITLTNTFKF